MLNDLKDNVKVVAMIHPASYTGTVADGEIIDLQGYDSCVVCVQTGVVATADGSNYFTFTISEGDDPALGDAATATAIQGSFAVLNSTTADDVQVLSKVGYVGTKRYIRLVATETETASAIFSGFAVLGSARVAPVA